MFSFPSANQIAAFTQFKQSSIPNVEIQPIKGLARRIELRLRSKLSITNAHNSPPSSALFWTSSFARSLATVRPAYIIAALGAQKELGRQWNMETWRRGTTVVGTPAGGFAVCRTRHRVRLVWMARTAGTGHLAGAVHARGRAFFGFGGICHGFPSGVSSTHRVMQSSSILHPLLNTRHF